MMTNTAQTVLRITTQQDLGTALDWVISIQEIMVFEGVQAAIEARILIPEHQWSVVQTPGGFQVSLSRGPGHLVGSCNMEINNRNGLVLA